MIDVEKEKETLQELNIEIARLFKNKNSQVGTSICSLAITLGRTLAVIKEHEINYEAEKVLDDFMNLVKSYL